jgi:dTDP-glucose 4,6-dehydratase
VSRVVVAGGAGFLGSHLCDHLIARGDTVVCLDDLSTGSKENVEHLLGHPRFGLVVTDVSDNVELPDNGDVDAVCNLASPASPPAYLARPLETLAVGSEGTRRLLELAKAKRARFLMASTSEIYGDPEVHPQVESYRGNVDPTGPRSVYDEAKRFAEALTMAMHRTHGVNVGIARIFNTYGPRLSPGDGRVVSNFIVQALRGEPLTVYGDGSQTRSLCFVEDEIRGLVALLDSSDRSTSGIPTSAPCSTSPTSCSVRRGRRRTSRSSPCRWTTRRAAAPISRWRAASWAGSPVSACRTELPVPSSISMAR